MRVVKTQGVEGIQHRVIAHLAAEAGLDADDGHYDGGGYLQLLFGPLQPTGILPPEGGAGSHPCLTDKQRSVKIPGLGLPRLGDGIQHRLAQLSLGHGLLQIEQRDLQILA